MHPKIDAQWIWVVDVVFGGVITLGFEKLAESLDQTLRGPRGRLVRHLFIATCFFAFVIYDVGAWHLIVDKLPYKNNALSAARYALDLLMAFALLTILLRACRADPAPDDPW